MNDKQPPLNDVNKPKFTDAQSVNEQANKDLETIRHIINADAFAQADAAQTQRAREHVASVISEALYDRQNNDNSVRKILDPIVELSVAKSFETQRNQYIDYLYPLVGDLVRKFSISFIRDFIEKTNEIIGHSVTLKSVSWRFKAWQSGLSYSRYVASQIYVYQVHQVLLIHRETGILLNSVSGNGDDNTNSDVVSSMLSAISDFVSDSFKPSIAENRNGQKQELDEIKTDNFTLYIKQAPQALLVAAVTGNISPTAKDKLQSTLERIQTFHLPNLQKFTGDVSTFETTTEDLEECLLAEEKNQSQSNKKPWLALLLIFSVFAGIAYYSFVKWQTSHLIDMLYQLPTNQGMVINRVHNEGVHDIELTLLRDPRSIPISDWIKQSNIKADQFQNWVKVHQIPFISLDSPVIKKQVTALIDRFNLSRQNSNELSAIVFNPELGQITGTLSSAQALLLNSQLNDIQGVSLLELSVEFNETKNTLSDEHVTERILALHSGSINQLQITFDFASAEVPLAEMEKLKKVVELYKDVISFADELNLSVKLLVLGASDNIGNREVNQALSVKRALNTANALVALGINREEIMTSGLGIIADTPTDTNIRKAIINVILNKQ